MKNSIYSKRVVPSYHPGCSMAETGDTEYDDFDNPLEKFNIIPEGKKISFVEHETVYDDGFDGPYVVTKKELPEEMKNPSSIREEPLVTVKVFGVNSGINPLALVNPEVIKYAWVFFNECVVEKIKKFPYRYHQNTIAYGEFFRLENLDSFALQKVDYFEGWRVLRECEINGKVYQRPDEPEYIIEFVMEK